MTQSARPQPIVALDVPSLDAARSLVSALGDPADFYKVGLQLFTGEGPRVVDWLHGEGKRVFLDLKFHDIPNTVRHAAASARRLGVALLTVHASGGEAMLRAAVEEAGERTGVLAVTVLTSMDLAALRLATGHKVADLSGEVLRLASVARAAGAHGVVCAGSECAAVRAAHGEHLNPLIPGIRLGGSSADDQARVATPSAAAAAGAAYVVLGRTVTAAADPAAAYQRVLGELAS
jgi:orotidine-5'-phosphate decarboxylase